MQSTVKANKAVKNNALLNIQRNLDIARKALICGICKNVLQKPVILPCFKTVCELHLKNMKGLDCVLCQGWHAIPPEGFSENLMAKNKVDSQSYLSDEEKKWRAELDSSNSDFACLFERLELREPELEIFLYDYFAELRIKMDIHREEIKIEIDNIHERMLLQLNAYEKNCKEKLQLTNETLANLNKQASLDKFKEKCEHEFFKSSHSDVANFKLLKNEQNARASNLKSSAQNFEYLKLAIDNYSFHPCVFTEKTLFGELKINDYDIDEIHKLMRLFVNINCAKCDSNLCVTAANIFCSIKEGLKNSFTNQVGIEHTIITVYKLDNYDQELIVKCGKAHTKESLRNCRTCKFWPPDMGNSWFTGKIS